MTELTEAMSFEKVAKERMANIMDSAQGIAKMVADQHQFLAFHNTVTKNIDGYPKIVMKVLRDEALIVPYAEEDTALRDLDMAQRRRLERDGYSVPEEADAYRNVHDMSPNFVMPKAIVKLSVTFDMTLKVQTWELEVMSFNKEEGHNGFWGEAQAHPHAPNGGTPCFGDFAVPLTDAINKSNYQMAFTIADMFCNTYNQHDDAGHRVISWVNEADL